MALDLHAVSAAGADSIGFSSAPSHPPTSRDAVASLAYKLTPQACQGLLDFRPRRIGLWSHCLGRTPGVLSIAHLCDLQVCTHSLPIFSELL
jgi:hypothetical protein